MHSTARWGLALFLTSSASLGAQTAGSPSETKVRAIHLTTPLVVDGRLDDAVYQREAPFDGLIQVVPNYGEQLSERSDIWVMYDDVNVYVACRCHDSAPPSEWIVNELRRDTGGLRNNDHFGVMFDTFHDRRSGFAFYTNPLGARADYSVVDEGGSNTDWNPVWTSRTGRFDGGWTVEMAIPLKSIRYRPGAGQEWGIQIRRSIRRRNEWGYLTRVPQILAGPQALNRISAAGTLTGLDLPSSGANLELKPYIVSRATTDRARDPVLENVIGRDAGGDLKYQVTPSLTLDATLHTDFAQVEVDEQQVNLTRFGLFFPEKRDFFLEGRGVFDFGRGGNGGADGSDTPSLFYSRRIGLNRGRVVPIIGGTRLTGKLGPWALGAMNIETGREGLSATLPTNFSVLRLKRDVFSRGAIGMIATNRSRAANDSGVNRVYGIDGAFGVTQDIVVGSYWARTEGASRGTDDQSWQARAEYSADRYGARAELLDVGRDFRPDVGFLRRSDFRRSYGELRFSPRPSHMPSVRKFSWVAGEEYIEAGTRLVDSRTASASFTTEFQSSDQFMLSTARAFERLSQPFTPTGSPAAIPVGGYSFTDATASYTIGAQRRASGTLSVRAGHYYDGSIRSISLGSGGGNAGRISLNTHLSLEPSLSITRIERAGSSFTTRLARGRWDYAFTPLMFASALVQYSSADHAVSNNVRFRWEYAPGSEVFLVYTDERGTGDIVERPTTLLQGLRNRALIFKINRLLRF